MDTSTVQALAEALERAQSSRRPLHQIADDHPEMVEADAYAVQAALVDRLVETKGHTIGWKVGATNEAVQAMLGTPEPFYGRLLDGCHLGAGAEVRMDGLISPMLECELALKLRTDLPGPGVTRASAALAIAQIAPALEVVDPRTLAWREHVWNAITDNGLQARCVLGAGRPYARNIDLSKIRVVLAHGGQDVAEGTGANVLGDPLNVLVWLANKLADHGLRLAAGDVVMTGTITPVVPLHRHDTMLATFTLGDGTRLGTVSAEFI